MWHQKKNERFSDRVVGPFSSQGPHDGNNIVPGPVDVSDKDFHSESSRKRKSVDMDYPANAVSLATSQSVLGSSRIDESKHQHKSDVLPSMHEQANTIRGFSTPTPAFEPEKVFQPVRYQDQSYSLTQENKQNVPVAVADKINNFHPSTQQEAFHQKGLADIMKLLAGKIPNLSDLQAASGNFFGQIERHKHTYPDQNAASMENIFSDPVRKAMGIAAVGTSSLETAHREGNVTEQSFLSYKNEVISKAPCNNGVNPEQKLKHGNYGNNGTQNMENKEGSVTENGNYSKGEHNAHNLTGVLTRHEHGQSDDSQCVARTLDGKSKLHAENANSNTEKLWEGIIQLSTSVTTSAVAFFKSGEKAPEVTWSESLAVKGKVRLEAFERFIQELPRARSRGLMVISLRWDVGSSKIGLEGMKQVAKGYKEGNKVGYAQISPAVDLYVCPRSDTIITILAKYGFFKGMAALEEDQDSLIGCVVWRKNHSSSDSTPKKSKSKSVALSEQPLNSAPSSATPVTESDNTPATVGIPESKRSEKKTHPVPHSTPAIAMCLNSHSQNNHTSSEVANSTIQSRGLEKSQAGLPQNITRENRQLPVDDDDNDDLPEFDFGAACGIDRRSVCKSPITSGNVSDSVQLGRTVPAERANSTGGHMPSSLPAAQPTGIASQQRSQATTLPVVSHGNQPAKEFDEDKSFRPVMSVSGEKAVANDSERTVTTSTGLPARKNIWDDDDDDMPEWCPPDQQHQSRPTTVSTTLPSVPNPIPDNKLPPPPPPSQPPAEAAATRPSSSCMQAPAPNWKTDNQIPGPPPITNPRPPSHMPENILPGPPPVRATSRPSFSYIASPMPNRNSENTLPGPPPRPLLPPPPPVPNHPQPPSQHRHVGVQPPIGHSPSTGFTYISAPRPQANSFETRPPVRPPPGWRGWQP